MSNGDQRENNLSSPDIEMSVIGSMFVNDNAAYHALNQLDKKDFSNQIYREVFNVTSDQYEEKYEIDKNLIQSHFKTHYNSDAFKYTNAINKAINFSKPSNIEEYCQELQAFTYRRDLVDKADELKMKAMDMTAPEEELYKKTEELQEAEFRTNPDIARTSSQIKEEAKDQEPQLETGLKEWDNWFYEKGGRGLGTTELIFGRPGHGKTYYLFRKEGQLAINGSVGLHFHLEDTDVEAASRIDAVVPPEEYHKQNDNILVITEHRYLHDIIKDIRYYSYKYDTDWVAVDHMGRVKVYGYSARDKNAAMIETSNQLTDACEQLNVHGMFTVQPNKSYKGRKGWDNLLREEDLKGASEIFEDAFVVSTLMRPNIYPELRKSGMREQSDGNMEEEHWVEMKGGGEAPYNSVFLTQIKNRRQALDDDFLHMIQDGDQLVTEREFRNKIKEKVKEDSPPHPAEEDVDIPF